MTKTTRLSESRNEMFTTWIPGSGFRVHGAGFRFYGAGFWVQGSGFRVQSSGFRVQGSWCRVQGAGFTGQGPGGRVDGRGLSSAHLRLRLPESKTDMFPTCQPTECTIKILAHTNGFESCFAQVNCSTNPATYPSLSLVHRIS